MPIEAVKWLLSCYFNDFIGSLTFMSYCNIILSLRGWKVYRLWQILLILSGCGIVWEVLTPMFRKNSVADVWDIVAYLLGGLLYWILAKRFMASWNDRDKQAVR